MFAVAGLIVIFLVGIFYQYSYLQGCVSHLIASTGSFLAGTLCRQADVKVDTCQQVGENGRSHRSKLSKRLYKLIAAYLLLRIGFVGGAELAGHGVATMIVPAILAVSLSVFMCLLVFVLLTNTTSFDRETNVSLAAHFGSVSVGTFTVALAFLSGLGIPFSPIVTAWVALMELPAVFTGILLLGQGIGMFRRLLQEDKTLSILPIALVMGVIVGPQLLHTPALKVLFETAFEPALAYFLFEMGRQARANVRDLVHVGGSATSVSHDQDTKPQGYRQLIVSAPSRLRAFVVKQWTYFRQVVLSTSRRTLICFGLGMPLLGGTLGAAIARLAGLSLGDATILGTLLSSASYVAAPTAMGAALNVLHKHDPEKAAGAVSTSLSAALGITLPFNILIGLRIYLWEAQLFEAPGLAVTGIAVVLSAAALLVTWHKWLRYWLPRTAAWIMEQVSTDVDIMHPLCPESGTAGYEGEAPESRGPFLPDPSLVPVLAFEESWYFLLHDQ